MNTAIDIPGAHRPAPAWPLPASARPKTALPAGDSTTRDLRKGETLAIDRPQGQAILCTHGALWITYEQALPEGTGEAGSRMLVHALTDACVSVMPSSARQDGAPVDPQWLR